jgi:DNA-directed RNA polymerase subunit M/transcription elongation factor TFIIS
MAAALTKPWELRPECVKCGGDRVSLQVIQTMGESADTLFVTCDRCGYVWTMKTKDAK